MKDFDEWNKEKKYLNEKGLSHFYHVREIWWCSVGINVGSEQDGYNKNFKRPVLIIKSLSKETCIVVPLTTAKSAYAFRINIGTITGKESEANLSQLRVIDTRRLISRITILDKEKFEVMKKSIRDFFI